MPKLTVFTPLGTFTRKTERTYQFIIVAEAQTEAWIRRVWEANRKYALESIQYHLTFLQDEVDRWGNGKTYGDQVKEHEARLAEIPTLEAAAIERAAADFAASRGTVLGWSGTRKNAEAKAASEAKNGQYRNIHIFPVPKGD